MGESYSPICQPTQSLCFRLFCCTKGGSLDRSLFLLLLLYFFFGNDFGDEAVHTKTSTFSQDSGHKLNRSHGAMSVICRSTSLNKTGMCCPWVADKAYATLLHVSFPPKSVTTCIWTRTAYKPVWITHHMAPLFLTLNIVLYWIYFIEENN